MLSGAASPIWQEQADRVAAVCEDSVPGLVGVYVHGSAALGGLTAGSDLDILVVAGSGPGGTMHWRKVGRRLLAEANHPRPLELSVVTDHAAAAPSSPWPFLLHVAGADRRVVLGADGGDPDLATHCAVTRAAGIPVFGPDPATVLGQVGRRDLLAQLRVELAWGLDHADQRYAVLNACRARAVLEDRVLLSKADGAAWWQRRSGPSALVAGALAAQEQGRDLGPSSARARDLVTGVGEAIDEELSRLPGGSLSC